MPESARADSQQQMGMRWRDRAEKLELQALRHAGEYGKGNDVYVSFIARAETLKDCANELEFYCNHGRCDEAAYRRSQRGRDSRLPN